MLKLKDSTVNIVGLHAEMYFALGIADRAHRQFSNMPVGESHMDDKDILLRMYLQECEFARHHEELRATAANIMIGVTAGILGLIAFDQKISANDLPLTIFLTILGIFGAVFNSKHCERVRLHLNRGKQYFVKLDQVTPELELMRLRQGGDSATKSKFRILYSLRLNSFWLALHLLISLLGASISVLIVLHRVWP